MVSETELARDAVSAFEAVVDGEAEVARGTELIRRWRPNSQPWAVSISRSVALSLASIAAAAAVDACIQEAVDKVEDDMRRRMLDAWND